MRARGAEVLAPTHAELDLTDAFATRSAVEAARPDAIVHAAILNDQRRMLADRELAWQSYVGATRHVVEAANAVGAHVVLISTDWVFDGTQGGADEKTRPNPVNLYGFLKAAAEVVVAERAQRGAVARLAGVQGVHWARPRTPRAQDAGFGYLVASLVDTLSAGLPFTVWEDPAINMIATPTLATDAGEMLARIVERGSCGIFHCTGGEAIDRRGLAAVACEVFELDPSLLRFGPPPPGALPGWSVPCDTSLDARVTAAALGVELAGCGSIAERLRGQLETRELAA
jgi:dTDP-4-dehydrorhamnose reductase